MRAAVQGAGPVQTGAGVDPPSYLLAQKRLLWSALVRRARSTTSESRRATRSAGVRQLRRLIDATLARNAFAARRALRRLRLHFFELVAPSARITRALSGRAPVRGNSADLRKQAAARSTRRAPRRWHIRRPPATPREAERGRRTVSWSWSRAGRRSRAQNPPLRRPHRSSPSTPSCVRRDATSTAARHAASTPAAESPQR